MDIHQIIAESTKDYHLPEEGCHCGCNTCHLTEPVKTESKSIIETIKPLKTIIESQVSKLLKEYKPSAIIQLEGMLITDITEIKQEEILSDIRSITGITIVSSKKLSNDQYNSNYHKSKLNIKIDLHPFIGKGGFGKEQLKDTLLNIKKVQGVRSFKLITTPKTTTI
jgi:hypothetical protein